MTLTTLQLSNPARTVTFRSSGKGETLVLLHGVGMQSAAWHPQMAGLEKFYRVIALDLPGHGGSERLEDAAPLESYVAWCCDVLQALGLGPVNLAGHSMGALIAGGVAGSNLNLVRRVALLNGVYKRSPAARQAVVARANEIANGTFDPETPLDRWFGHAPSDIAARASVAAWLGAVDPQGYAAAYAAFAGGDAVYADAYCDIDCPFLALTGDGDPNSTPQMAHLMANVVRQGRVAVIEDHRHMVNLTAPDQVNAHLLKWLRTPALGKVAS